MIIISSTQVSWLRITYPLNGDFLKKLFVWEERNKIFPVRILHSGNGSLEALYQIEDATRIAAWMSETMIGQVSWV